MWPDPNLAKTKPHSLGGTPANKFSAIICASIVVTFAAVLNLVPYIPHFKKKIEKAQKEVAQAQQDREVKAFLADPLVQGAIQRKQKEYEQEPEPLL